MIWLFGPTHIAGELGLRLTGCRPPALRLLLCPFLADVGSAKQSREHPPVHTGLNFAVHGLCGFTYLNSSKAEDADNGFVLRFLFA